MSTVRIEGLEQLRRRLKGADLLLVNELKSTVGGASLAIGMVAQANAPVDDGTLVASFFTDGAEVNEERKTATATVGYDVPYAPAEHEGIHYQKKNQKRSFFTGRREKYKSIAPPKWLEHAAEGFRRAFASAVKTKIQSALQTLSKK